MTVKVNVEVFDADKATTLVDDEVDCNWIFKGVK